MKKQITSKHHLWCKMNNVALFQLQERKTYQKTPISNKASYINNLHEPSKITHKTIPRWHLHFLLFEQMQPNNRIIFWSNAILTNTRNRNMKIAVKRTKHLNLWDKQTLQIGWCILKYQSIINNWDQNLVPYFHNSITWQKGSKDEPDRFSLQ